MTGEVERRRIGRTGLTARAVGVGWAAITGLPDRESTATIRRAIEVGFDFHDTSSMYADSERRVGLALEGGWRETGDPADQGRGTTATSAGTTTQVPPSAPRSRTA